MDQIEVEGLRIAFQRTGDGPPVVLVHGGLTDSRVWRRQLDDLSDEFTVVAWDAPGCGRSSDPPERFGWADYGRCLASFITGLGLVRPHVIGAFFGAALALELSRQHPTVPMSLVLAPPYAGWAGSFPPEAIEQRLQQALQPADMPPDRWVPGYIPNFLSEAAPGEVVDELSVIMSDSHPAAIRVMARVFATLDLRDVLPLVAAPTLLVSGGADQPASLKMAEDFHAKIPASRLIVLPGVGAQTSMEAAEDFNIEVRDFLHSVRT